MPLTPSLETDMADFAFMDSGTGGIGYMMHLAKKYPQYSCLYLGDTAHFPYGEKTPEEIIACASETVEIMLERFQPKAIVVACNTMSVVALQALRSTFPQIPFVGTVPAIKLASNVSKNRRIGLLATTRSVRSPYTDELIRDFASDCHVARRGDPDLIAFIEHELYTATDSQIAAAIQPAVDFFSNEQCDTVILGCTHFIHLADEIQKAFGESVQVVDSRDGVVRQALRVLPDTENGSAGQLPDGMENCTFFCTGATAAQEAEYQTLSGKLGIRWGGILKKL